MSDPINDFKLVEPEKLVNPCLAVWKGELVSPVQLFENGKEINIYVFLPKDVKEYWHYDEVIAEYCDSDEKFWRALYEINAKYHTRVQLVKGNDWTDREWSREETTRMCKAEIEKQYCVENSKGKNEATGIDEFIEICKTKADRYEYSFATKVFSFVSEGKLPIYDRYVVTLIDHYLTEKQKEEVDKQYREPLHNYKKSMLGTYSGYREAYSLFKRLYNLENRSNKEIDIFLWTYGKAVQKYWSDCGMLSFESVQYIPINRR